MSKKRPTVKLEAPALPVKEKKRSKRKKVIKDA